MAARLELLQGLLPGLEILVELVEALLQVRILGSAALAFEISRRLVPVFLCGSGRALRVGELLLRGAGGVLAGDGA